MIRLSQRGLASLTVNNRIATVSLANPPVNVLNRQTIKNLTDHFQNLPKNRDIDGIILTSKSDGMFCAGLDLKEFAGGKNNDEPYWSLVQNMWLALYTCPLPGKVRISD